MKKLFFAVTFLSIISRIYGSEHRDAGVYMLTPLHTGEKSIIIIKRNPGECSQLEARVIVNLEHPQMKDSYKRWIERYNARRIKNSSTEIWEETPNSIDMIDVGFVSNIANQRCISAFENIIAQTFKRKGTIAHVRTEGALDTVMYTLSLLSARTSLSAMVSEHGATIDHDLPRIILDKDVKLDMFLKEARSSIPSAYRKLVESAEQQAPSGWNNAVHQSVVIAPLKRELQQQALRALKNIDDAEEMLKAGKTPVFGARQ